MIRKPEAGFPTRPCAPKFAILYSRATAASTARLFARARDWQIIIAALFTVERARRDGGEAKMAVKQR
jgi:hypothetical protein